MKAYVATCVLLQLPTVLRDDPAHYLGSPRDDFEVT